MKLRKAVIPVAGLGTRFLPATKTVPKELLPIVDIPSIQYVVQEAVDAGIQEIIFVTGRGKDSIEDHFDEAPELEQVLAERGQTEMVEMLRRIKEMTEVVSVRQKKPLGLGHAVLCARDLVGDEPFAVMLADDLIDTETPCIRQLLEIFEETRESVIALMEVLPEEVQRYGVIRGQEMKSVSIRSRARWRSPRRERLPRKWQLSAAIFCVRKFLLFCKACRLAKGVKFN